MTRFTQVQKVEHLLAIAKVLMYPDGRTSDPALLARVLKEARGGA